MVADRTPDAGDASADRLPDRLADLGFAGVVLVAAGESTVLALAAGRADRGHDAPNRLDTRFGVASVGKLFTAAAVARLVGRGELRFDTRLVDVLGPAERPSRLSPDVTLHHLLTHTSGVADYFDEYGAAGFEELWAALPSYAVRRPADLLPLFADRPPRAAPGTEVRYCNAGYVLLGLVLERVLGRRFDEVVADEVFGPAGMADAGFFDLDAPPDRTATGYLTPDGPGPWRTNVFSIPAAGQPDGGAFATAGDLVRFVGALASGDLLDADVRRQVLAPHVVDYAEGCAYGYGVRIAGGGRDRAIAGVGEDPGASARVALYPERGIRVAVVSNVTHGAGPAFREVVGTVIEARG